MSSSPLTLSRKVVAADPGRLVGKEDTDTICNHKGAISNARR